MENQRAENTFDDDRSIIERINMRSPRQLGKVSILSLAAIVIVGMIVASMVLAKEDPSAVGAQFMDALARHDVDKLTEMTYTGQTDPNKIAADKKVIREQWDFSVNTAGLHYPFHWTISGSMTGQDSHATVTVQINKGGANGYDERYELPLEKEGEKWKVDARAISRTMFPAMPQ
jgi:hypothetical protein